MNDSGEHFNPHFEYLRLNCQGYSQSEYQAGMFGGEGAASMKHKAQGHAQFLNCFRSDGQTLFWSKSFQRKW